MIKREMIYEGKAKRVFNTDNDECVIVSYKDDATAFNGAKKGTIEGKGAVNNRVSNFLCKLLESKGIPTHYIKELSKRETLVKKVDIIPVEVIVRNIVAGGLADRLGLKEGEKLKSTVLEYSYKDDDLGDPMINDDHIAAMELATEQEMRTIAMYVKQINVILTEY